MKFHENACSGSPVVSYGQTDRHDDLIVPYRSFAKALKKWFSLYGETNNNYTLIKSTKFWIHFSA